ncbi:DNA-processing protein DprA [Deinococcus radiophilus]|uniref:DNA-protecting protein DprA n=1 Tax=Deinococcus radiophilus TaxID=32062 RepID=A0A3S0IK00_9DEIO|nr:DNA-processing protein DprA [Deinococcus radiophilus]RTR25729.1 DNA-protecting protein DprA [Deinococcus radiophilus]UFA50198.1 DNA-processing protein DprA [Deinococcus radiophilus]
MSRFPSDPALDQSAELRALLALRLTPGLGPRRIEALRQHFGSAVGALAAPPSALSGVEGLDRRSAAAVTKPAYDAAAQELERVAQARSEGKDIRLLGRGFPDYPPALEALGDPPAVLWVRGPLPDLPASPYTVGIVGTRGASPHALSLTRQIATDLSSAGVTVVSGLARGVDTAAHTAAVEAGALSIGVVGTGVDRVYPAENVDLARRLSLVSEYPLGTGPQAHHFPQRNRLIAALSSAVLVVEGELKSGSLITATHALECGRTVFAVPGRAGDPRAAGPHRLLREGAVLTESAADILTELGWTGVGGTSITSPPDLPGEQAAVLAALTEPRTLDDLSAQTGLSLSDLQTTLMMLQLAGHAEESGGRWLRR